MHHVKKLIQAKRNLLIQGSLQLKCQQVGNIKKKKGLIVLWGGLVGKKVELNFDLSEMGYAGGLNPDEIGKHQIQS